MGGAAAGGFRLDAASWSQLGAWGQYDPGPDLDQLTTPTLAIFGGNDPLVPVHASIARLRDTAGFDRVVVSSVRPADNPHSLRVPRCCCCIALVAFKRRGQ
jgi:pimeloyl-ACP methyl ester carboxylesterase